MNIYSWSACCKFLILISLFFLSSCIEKSNSDNLTGKYLGQVPPDSIPKLFAPGIVSTNLHEHSSLSVSPDGSELMWTVSFMDNYAFRYPDKLISIKQVDGKWKNPDFSKYFGDLENFYNASWSPDGKRIYFSSHSGLNDVDTTYGSGDIWYIEKSNADWSKPVHLDSVINSKNVEGTPYVTKDYSLYFMGYLEGVRNNYGILRSKFVDGKYQKTEVLPEVINSKELDWTPFISPDESYIIFSSFREGGFGRGDLYISFRNKNDEWSKAINLGDKINTESNERFPSVSPDGEYLFFLTDKVDSSLTNNKNLSYSDALKKYHKPGNGWCDIYWVKADFIEKLKPVE